jgi:hypothetical protein
MSGLLTRLAQRALAHSPAMRPRFHPELRSPAAPQHPNATRPLPPAQPARAPSADATSVDTLTQSPDAFPPDTTHAAERRAPGLTAQVTSREPEPPAAPTAESHRSARTPEPPESVPSGPTVLRPLPRPVEAGEVPPFPHLQMRTAPAATDPASEPRDRRAPHAPQPAPGIPGTPAVPAPAPHVRPEPAGHTVQGRPMRRVAPGELPGPSVARPRPDAQRRPEQIPPVARPVVAAASTATQRRAEAAPAATPAPVIHVSIGRVEIRAAVVPAPPSHHAPPATAPQLSLAEYLRRQAQGGRS